MTLGAPVDVECSAGIEQSEDMKRFLWYVAIFSTPAVQGSYVAIYRNNHFAAIASDQPSLEVCPGLT